MILFFVAHFAAGARHYSLPPDCILHPVFLHAFILHFHFGTKSTFQLNVQQKLPFMQEFLPIIHFSPLFSGISEPELAAMLTCLNARQEEFLKDAFLLRAGI